jgi:hypothetical protein
VIQQHAQKISRGEHETVKPGMPVRFTEACSAGDCVRQGDLYLVIIDKIPDGYILNKKPSVQLVPGNTQGLREKISAEEEIYEKTRINEEKQRQKTQDWIDRFGAKASQASRVQSRVKMLDKIHNKYEVTSFESINKMLQMKVNFEIVQALLYGNFFAYKKNENRFNSVYLEDKFYILSSLNKKKLKRSLEEKDLNKPVIQDVYVNDSTYRIDQVQVEDQRINKILNTEYSDFRLTDGGLFPFKSKTNIKAEKNIEIRIEYGKVVKAESLDFPFNIPNNYERIR